MKKIVALSLAALMVLSLSTVAFAISGHYSYVVDPASTAASPYGVQQMIEGAMYVSMRDIDSNEEDILLPNIGTSVVVPGAPASEKSYARIQPGWTAYYPLMTKFHGPASVPTPIPGIANDSNLEHIAELVTAADAVKSVRISTKYILGKSDIESIKIVYKKIDVDGDVSTSGDQAYGYCLAIATKDFGGTGSRDFAAEIRMSKTSGEDKDGNSYVFDMTYGVEFRMQVDVKVNIYKNVFRINPGNPIIYDSAAEESYEFPQTNGVYYEAKLFGQGATLLALNLVFDKEASDMYPHANLDFYNGTGTFNLVGTLVIPAAPGSFVYGRDAEGNFVEIEAEYDDAEEAFRIPTRALGSYVVSDVELNLAAASAPVEAPVEAPVFEEPVLKPNVPTGAVA